MAKCIICKSNNGVVFGEGRTKVVACIKCVDALVLERAVERIYPRTKRQDIMDTYKDLCHIEGVVDLSSSPRIVRTC